MKKINLDRRNITIILSYLCLTIFFFIIGFFSGKTKNTNDVIKYTSADINSVPYASATPLISESPSLYRVILEDGQIRLYFDEGGISRLVSSEEISEDAYPVSDIATLKKGMVFSSTDEAIALMENFIS